MHRHSLGRFTAGISSAEVIGWEGQKNDSQRTLAELLPFLFIFIWLIFVSVLKVRLNVLRDSWCRQRRLFRESIHYQMDYAQQYNRHWSFIHVPLTHWVLAYGTFIQGVENWLHVIRCRSNTGGDYMASSTWWISVRRLGAMWLVWRLWRSHCWKLVRRMWGSWIGHTMLYRRRWGTLHHPKGQGKQCVSDWSMHIVRATGKRQSIFPLITYSRLFRCVC